MSIDADADDDTNLIHFYVNGYVDPTSKLQWIPIVKNGTNFLRYHLITIGWQSKQIPLINEDILRFSIIRDPYERFISGVVEELEMYIDLQDKTFCDLVFNRNYCELFLKFLFDKVLLESSNFLGEHTTLQINLLKIATDNSLDLYDSSRICYFKMNDKLGYQINHWLKTYDIQNTINNGKINSKSVNDSRLLKLVQEFLFDYKNNKYKEKIYNYLEPDYIFFNNAKFINE